MTNLPRALRETLAREVPFSALELRHEARARDGTVKALFATADGRAAGGGADAIPRRAALDLPLLAVGLPADVHVLRDGADALRAQPHVLGDPRPGPALPAPGADRPLRLHGHGRAAAEPRRGARGVRAAAGPRHRAPAHRDLDRRLDPRDRTAHGVRAAAAPGALAARGRRSAALGADAGQRALPAAGRARGVPRVLRAQAPAHLRRVRDAGRRQRPLRAGRRARRAARTRTPREHTRPQRSRRPCATTPPARASRACSRST